MSFISCAVWAFLGKADRYRWQGVRHWIANGAEHRAEAPVACSGGFDQEMRHGLKEGNKVLRHIPNPCQRVDLDPLGLQLLTPRLEGFLN